MFRLIGFIGGIILFLVLGILKVNGYVYFIICASLSISSIFFLVIFRMVAKYLNGFWRVWSKRLQRWISNAFLCLGHHVQLPEYEVIALSDRQSGQTTIAARTTRKRNILWGLIEMLICVGFTGAAPLIIIFIFFIYGEAIYYECQFQKKQKEFKDKKEEVIARQSARMSLGIPLSQPNTKQRKSSSSSPPLFISYPLLEPAIVPKHQHQNINFSGQQELRSRSSFEKPHNTTHSSQMHQVNVTGISTVTEQSRSYTQSYQEGLRDSLPCYKGKKDIKILNSKGMIENDEL